MRLVVTSAPWLSRLVLPSYQGVAATSAFRPVWLLTSVVGAVI